jgi:hypothetical protein
MPHSLPEFQFGIREAGKSHSGTGFQEEIKKP